MLCSSDSRAIWWSACGSDATTTGALGKISGGTVPAQIWRNFMVSALAVDRRPGPPLPPEFQVPQRQPEPERKSPLPDDWSDGTKALRDLADDLAKLFGDR